MARTVAISSFRTANELVSEVVADHLAMLGGHKVQWNQFDKTHLDAAKQKAASGNVGALKNMLKENMEPLFPASIEVHREPTRISLEQYESFAKPSVATEQTTPDHPAATYVDPGPQ